MLTWGQYEEHCARNLKPDMVLVRQATEGLLHHRSVTEEQQRKLAEINAGWQKNRASMYSIYQLRQFRRLSMLFDWLEGAEELQFDKARLSDMTYHQMLEAMKYVSADIHAIFDELTEQTTKKEGSFNEKVETLAQYNFIVPPGVPTPFDAQIESLDPRSRASLVERVREMTARIRRGEGPPPLPDSKVIDSVAGDGQS